MSSPKTTTEILREFDNELADKYQRYTFEKTRYYVRDDPRWETVQAAFEYAAVKWVDLNSMLPRIAQQVGSAQDLSKKIRPQMVQTGK
jgi:hypothetical protein